MQKVRVLIGAPLTQDNIKAIAQVDPGLEVVDAVELVKSELGLTGKGVIAPWMQAGAATPLPPEEASRKLDQMLADTEVILGWRLPRNLLARAPRLRWVQAIGAGIDLMADQSGLLKSNVLLSGLKKGVFSLYWVFISLPQLTGFLQEPSLSLSVFHMSSSPLPPAG